MKHTMLLLFMAASFFVTPSCKDDEKDAANCAANYSSDLSAATSALTSAASVYYAIPSPTTADCNTFKAAYQAYLDALQPYTGCAAFTSQQQADLAQAIQDAQDDLATLC